MRMGNNQFTAAWTEDEERWITNEYPRLTFEECTSAMPGRTLSALKHKASRMGIKKTDETISRQNSKINKGKVRTEENRKKISLGLTGKEQSVDTREKRRESMLKSARREKDHYNWKGDNYSRKSTMRWRARRLVSKGKCAYCEEQGKHVHHRNGNPYNNGISNLIRLCIKHHIVEHQVMKALREATKYVWVIPDDTLERQLIQ